MQTIRELKEVEAIYKNPSALWSSPIVTVPKPGTTNFRLTVDLRGLNAKNFPIQSAMPHLESKLQDVARNTCFANIDLVQDYWQVSLSKALQ